ncbi:proton-coupled zinc antiporter SLC30A8 [Sebastes fasciatus]|uniref:proton-coupled zinc antiporter SLC30A8 n=1 Tax=Sebastes fasciatus TaxID=394691 RepID=UPI003D9F3D63
MFQKKKDPERLVLVTDVRTSYTTLSRSSIPNQETLQIDGSDGVKHCHDNSRAQEDREREKKVARRRLYVVSVICLVFMICEVIGGYFAGSLAVMTDAAHLLADLVSFLISLLSLWLSSRPATHKLSYGWHRAEILGALLSIFTIWLVTGVLVYLAVRRLINNDYTIEGTIMLITSGCAVLANIVMALVLHQSGHGHSHGGLSSSHGHSHGGQRSNGHGHSHGGVSSNGHGHSHGGLGSQGHGHSHKNGNEHSQALTHSNHDHADAEQNRANHDRRPQRNNASVRAAFVHVLGDLLQSVSVFISAIIIFFKPEYKMADPICTFLFSIFVLCTTITIMKDILVVLMEGAPTGVNYGEVRDGLLAVKGVKAVHNLHIWALTMNQTVLTAHVAIDETVDAQTVLREMTQACFSSYNFHAITIQMERQANLKPGCTLCEEPKK